METTFQSKAVEAIQKVFTEELESYKKAQVPMDSWLGLFFAAETEQVQAVRMFVYSCSLKSLAPIKSIAKEEGVDCTEAEIKNVLNEALVKLLMNYKQILSSPVE